MKKFWFVLLLLVSFGTSMAQTVGNEWIDYNKQYYKFGVREQRFYRISYTALLNAGIAHTPAEHFQLWRDGQQVPLYTSVPSGPLPVNGFIEFFGTPNTGMHERELYNNPAHHTQPERSMFSDTAWYFLTINNQSANARFSDMVNDVANTTLQPDSFYMHTANPLFNQLGFNGGFSRVFGAEFLRSSTWDEGESLSSGFFSSTRTIEFNLTGLRAFMNGPAFQIQLGVAGNTAADRRYLLRLNNELADSAQVPFFTLTQKTLQNLSLSKYIVNDGLNIKFNSNNDIWFENVTVNRLLITYPRQFHHNQQNPLAFSLPANAQGNHLRIAALPNGTTPPVLYDLTNQQRYIGVLKQDSSLFLLAPSAQSRTLVAGTQVGSHIRVIGQLRPVSFKNYTQAAEQGNYIIITNRHLRGGPTDQVEAYRAYRASTEGGSYRAIIADVDELADQFCYGNRKNPLAIRRFIKFANTQFTQKPKGIFLIGRGTNYYQYFRAAGGGATGEILNTVPTFGIPASDNLLAADNNLNPVPIIPIGRLSAISPAEVKVYFDKVKEFEALQRKKPTLPSDNAWRKKMIYLIGGDDVFLASSVLSNFINSYIQIIRNPATGANTFKYDKLDPGKFPADMKFVEESISQGTGLVTYFGHSSSSSIDFNLGGPEQFKNQPGKYPIYLANGCRAGNIFDYTGARLTSKEISISDNFTFTPAQGSIAFISNSDLGVINYQNLFTREWHIAFDSLQFGKTIGEIQQEALKNAYNRTGTLDFLNRCNIEQSVLHGDPVIVPLPVSNAPDFAVETKFMQAFPEQVATETDTVDLKIHLFNLGKAVNGTVLVQVQRELPDGTSRQLYQGNHNNLYHADSLMIRMPLKGLFEEGNGAIVVQIDPGNEWTESDKDNNVAVLPLPVARRYVQPTFPFNYSMVHGSTVTLKASTTDPVTDTLSYVFQLDTTRQFNSGQLVQAQINSPGGNVSWTPSITFVPGTVYYWRASLAGVSAENSEVFSFLYQLAPVSGFNQSHYFQHLTGNTTGMPLDSNRVWNFPNKLQNIFVSHGIFSTSGQEDAHFSISLNGSRIIQSACLGQSIIFNLFDGNTMEPIRNDSAGFMGSAPICGAFREYNFEYKYFNHENRKRIMDFLDWIPKGTYVAARLVVDPPHDSLQVRFWKNDTAIYGKNNSLFHRLYNQGFYDLDSLNRTRTFFFLFSKDDSAKYKPYSLFSKGVSDRMHASVFPVTRDTTAQLLSPWMGPSAQWEKAQWESTGYKDAPDMPSARFELWGKTQSGSIVKLKTFSTLSGDVSISDIDAGMYPSLQWRMLSSAGYNSYPAQLQYWRLLYTPVPDGALSGNDHWVWLKNTFKPVNDTIALELAFKNVSEYALPATTARIRYINETGQVINTFTLPLKALAGGDTAIIRHAAPVSIGEGAYKMQIEVNEEGLPAEQNYFNNRAMIPFWIDGGVLPLQWLQWDATRQQSGVLLQWKLIADKEVASYMIEHAANGSGFKSISAHQGHAAGTEAVGGSFLHKNPAPGQNQYRLRVVYKDGTILYSAIAQVRYDFINQVQAAPNPFNHYFTVYPSNAAEPWSGILYDINGRAVKEIKGQGSTKIEMASFASGIYWLYWKSANETQILKLIKQ